MKTINKSLICSKVVSYMQKEKHDKVNGGFGMLGRVVILHGILRVSLRGKSDIGLNCSSWSCWLPEVSQSQTLVQYFSANKTTSLNVCSIF